MDAPRPNESATLRRNPLESVFPFFVSPFSRFVPAPSLKGDATLRPAVVTVCNFATESKAPANDKHVPPPNCMAVPLNHVLAVNYNRDCSVGAARISILVI
jgi:hypothetical protein